MPVEDLSNSETSVSPKRNTTLPKRFNGSKQGTKTQEENTEFLIRNNIYVKICLIQHVREGKLTIILTLNKRIKQYSLHGSLVL